MKALSTLILALFVTNFAFAQAGDDRLKEIAAAAKKEAEKGWVIGGGVGLDLTGLGLVNPRLGAGDNRIGFGGLINVFANNKQGKSFWNNSGSLQLAAQRIGGKNADFQKSLDILRLGSRYGYSIVGEKLFAAIDGTAETQLLRTYSGNLINGVDSNLLSEFLAPARFSIAPGIDYKPTKNLTFFFSPVSFNLTYVGNDDLAALPGQPLGNEEGKNNRSQIGFGLKGQYVNKYFKDRVAVSTKLAWFADYRKSLNGNVLWQNSVDIQIFKGLALGLFGDLFYDHFTLVQVEKAPAGTSPEDIRQYLGLKPALTGGFLLKYNKIF